MYDYAHKYDIKNWNDCFCNSREFREYLKKLPSGISYIPPITIERQLGEVAYINIWLARGR